MRGEKKPALSAGDRYGLVEEGPSRVHGSEPRKMKTPKRRLVSESVFDRIMLHSVQPPRNRSRSVTFRPRGGGKTPVVPNNQILISSFITPKRGDGH